MGYSGAVGKLIHEKNQKQKKSRDTVPLKGLGHQVHISFKSYQTESVYCMPMRHWF